MRLLRIREVSSITGLSNSSIYKQIRLGRFPEGLKITDRATAWSSLEIDSWIAERVESHLPISSVGQEKDLVGEEDGPNDR
jgi:prophage regulatory protein